MSRPGNRIIAAAGFVLLTAVLPVWAQEEAAREPEHTYTYDALFEPPEGRIIHGMGQWDKENKAYLQMLGDSSLYPLFHLFFFDIQPPRPWKMIMAKMRLYLEQEKQANRIPFISLEMSGVEKKDKDDEKKRRQSPYFGVDHFVAGSDRFDDRLLMIVDVLKEYERPVFFRIGGEFNGPWKGYHPYLFPKAFRKIVKLFRKEEAQNVAFVWCYEPAGPNDFNYRNRQGQAKWFPGADVVDWFGIDIFKRRDFSAEYELTVNGQLSVRGRTERFMRMAEQLEKPVVIAESSAVDITIESINAWEQWFGPYFSFIERHPGVKAFVYISADWTQYRDPDPNLWTDGRIHLNPSAGKRFTAELRKSKYIHAGDQHLLNGCKKPEEKKPKKKLRFDKTK